MKSEFGDDNVVLATGSTKQENKFCCCSLRTGSIIVACFYLVIGLALGGFFVYLTAASQHDSLLFGIFCAATVLQFLSCVFHVVLLCGAVKRKHKAIFAWIIFESIMIGFSLMGVIHNVFRGNTASLWALLYLALRFFFLYAISNYYKDLKQQNQSPPPYALHNQY